MPQYIKYPLVAPLTVLTPQSRTARQQPKCRSVTELLPFYFSPASHVNGTTYASKAKKVRASKRNVNPLTWPALFLPCFTNTAVELLLHLFPGPPSRKSQKSPRSARLQFQRSPSTAIKIHWQLLWAMSPEQVRRMAFNSGPGDFWICAMVHLVGNHHIYTHNIPPRSHNCTHRALIQTLAHMSTPSFKPHPLSWPPQLA